MNRLSILSLAFFFFLNNLAVAQSQERLTVFLETSGSRIEVVEGGIIRNVSSPSQFVVTSTLRQVHKLQVKLFRQASASGPYKSTSINVNTDRNGRAVAFQAYIPLSTEYRIEVYSTAGNTSLRRSFELITSVPTTPTRHPTASAVPTQSPAPTVVAPPVVPPTVAPTSNPNVTAPNPRVITLNATRGDAIVVQEGLPVFVAAVHGYRSLADIRTGEKSFAECFNMDIVRDLSPTGGSTSTFIPKGSPLRAQWEREGDAKKSCYQNIERRLTRLNTSIVGTGSVERASFVFDFTDANGRFNRIEGWNAAHIFNTPGTYSVKVTVTNEAGGIGRTTVPIIVERSIRTTYYVSPGGSDGDGRTPATAFKSIAKAKAVLRENNVELLFERGRTFNIGFEAGFLDITGSNVVVGAYGSGALPKILWTGGVAKSRPDNSVKINIGVSGITIENLELDSSGGLPDALIDNDGHMVAVRNIEVRNTNYFVVARGSADTRKAVGVFVTECRQVSPTEMGEYFVFSQSGSDIVVAGNFSANSKGQHNVRAIDQWNLLNVYSNVLRNTDTDKTGYDSANGMVTLQAGGFGHIARNTFFEGKMEIRPLGAPRSPRGEETVLIRIVNNTYSAAKSQDYATGTGPFIAIRARRVMIANNQVWLSKGPSVASTGVAVEINAAEPDTGQEASDVTIAHNTVVAAGDSAGRQPIKLASAAGIRVSNNLIIMPNYKATGLNMTPMTIPSETSGEYSCNVMAKPNKVGKRAFNPASDGVNSIKKIGTTAQTGLVTMDRWNSLLSARRAGRPADRFENILYDLTTGSSGEFMFVPQVSYRATLSCPLLGSVREDFFGRPRSEGSVSAGAYQME